MKLLNSFFFCVFAGRKRGVARARRGEREREREREREHERD
jgi:hypothetical protein